MVGGRVRRKALLDSFREPAPTPEARAATACRHEKVRRSLAELRSALTERQRRWLAVFELEARCSPDGAIDLERAANQLGVSRADAEKSLEEIRRLWADTLG